MISKIYAHMVRADTNTYERPIAPNLPLEIISKIVEDTLAADDISSLFTLSLVSKPWMYECRHRFFKGRDTISFHDINDILLFMRLISTSRCTFPNPIKCKRVEFLGMMKKERYYDLDYVSTAVQKATLALDVERGAFIGGTNRGIPYSVRDAFKEWWIIRDLTLSKGIHTPPVLFKFLGKLPHIQHLTLSHVEIDDPSGEFPSIQYSFPETLVKLSVVASADIWGFLKWSVLPGGGLDAIEDVQIQDLFEHHLEPNHRMLDCLSAMPNLRIFGLEPSCPGSLRGPFKKVSLPLSPDCFPRFDIPERQSLTKLQINLGRLPVFAAVRCMDDMVKKRLPRLSVQVLEGYIADDTGVVKEEHSPERLRKRFQSLVSDAKGGSRTRVIIRGCPTPAKDTT